MELPSTHLTPCRGYIDVFTRWCLIGLLVSFFCLQGHKAVSQEEEEGYYIYNTLKAGFGLPYGGLGLNYEFGIHRYSLYGGFGYRWSRGTITNPDPAFPDSVVEIKIDDSFNYGVGLHYHFINSQNPFQPRVGVYAGWVGNYYDRRIGLDDYNHSVYGWAFTLGAEFYTGPIIADLDLILVPAGDFVFNQEEHPYYTRTLVKLSAGVGIDLGMIFFKRKRKRFDINYQ